MEKQFDTRVHIRDPKTGKVVLEKHHTVHVRQNKEGTAETLYEQPPGSKMYFYPNGEKAVEASKQGDELAKLKLQEQKKAEELAYNKKIADARALLAKVDGSAPAEEAPEEFEEEVEESAEQIGN